MAIEPPARIPSVPLVRREEKIDTSRRRRPKQQKNQDKKKEQGKIDLTV